MPPISIEALLAKQKAEKEAASRPKFLTKEQRAAEALARRAAEVEAKHDQDAAARKKQDDLLRQAQSSSSQQSQPHGQQQGQYGNGGYRGGQQQYQQGGYQQNGRGGPGQQQQRGGQLQYGDNDRRRPGLGAPRGGGQHHGPPGGWGPPPSGPGAGQRRDFDLSNVPKGPKAMVASQPGGPSRPPTTTNGAVAANGSSEKHPNGTDMDVDTPSAPSEAPPPAEDAPPPPPSTDAPPPPPAADAPPLPPAADASSASAADAPPPPPDRPPTPPSMPPPSSTLPLSRPQPEVRLTLAEMAAQSAAASASAEEQVRLNQRLLQTRYLGAKPSAKKRPKKMSDKKFVFDWAAGDDTGFDEVDPMYRASGALTAGGKLYGRGVMAGFEREAIGSGSGEKKKGSLDQRHWTEKTREEMKERDWRIFREDFSIASRGGSIPHPLRYWHESDIPTNILDVIKEVGYTEPSPIQRQAIPLGLQNRDVIGVAETGSGKTAAFLVPMLAYIQKLPPMTDQTKGDGPYALVLAPTRELAQQIESEANKFMPALGLNCVSIVGGKSIEEQQFSLREGCHILIATPGRLKDCIERHILVLSQCAYVVMDEADRMVSLGFEDVLNFILDSLPVGNLKPDSDEAEDGEKMTRTLDLGGGSAVKMYRQTVMFSATMPPAVERLAKTYLRRPAIVTIGVAGQAVDRVEQRVEFISTDDKKRSRLLEILGSGVFDPPMIVFVNQKKTADQVAKDLSRAQWSCTTLHSGKNQEQREAALQSLRDGESDVLVATDLAGRGIDVPDVSLVVNWQMSSTIEAYVHRIGRTGRAGKTGVAVTFLNDADEDVMYDLKQELTKSPVSKCPNELSRHPAAQSKMSQAMKRRAADLEEG